MALQRSCISERGSTRSAYSYAGRRGFCLLFSLLNFVFLLGKCPGGTPLYGQYTVSAAPKGMVFQPFSGS